MSLHLSHISEKKKRLKNTKTQEGHVHQIWNWETGTFIAVLTFLQYYLQPFISDMQVPHPSCEWRYVFVLSLKVTGVWQFWLVVKEVAHDWKQWIENNTLQFSRPQAYHGWLVQLSTLFSVLHISQTMEREISLWWFLGYHQMIKD